MRTTIPSVQEELNRQSNAAISDGSANVKPADVMKSVWQAAVEAEMPIALWRQPRTNQVQGIVSLQTPLPQMPDFTQRQSGFYVAPFSESGTPLFLPADLLFEFGDSGISVEAAALGNGQHPGALEVLNARFAQALGAPDAVEWYTTRDNGEPTERQNTISGYEALVRDAVRYIRESSVAKVVVSRRVRAELPNGFHPVELFNALCARYAHAFTSLVGIPGVGTWIGASPELLVALDDTSLRTMALAGTQPRPDITVDPGTIQWGEKERVEQELVSEYVRDFFRDAGYNEFDEKGPQTVTAGKVFHLQTSFRIDLPEEERLSLANLVVERLHPTSAVCGMPRNDALRFILQNEGYDRSFYSGYLGPVFIHGKSSLFVNLRCMQLHTREATLYVGGGITADSNPTAEWYETEAKSQTILDVLRRSGDADTAPLPSTLSNTASSQIAPTQVPTR